MKKNLFFVMFFSCILQQVAFAEKDKNINSLSLEELLNINVVSASKQEEPLKETPVPVTVITEDMIKHLGARSIKDLLLTYVPGITYTQDTNEMYVSMRGIYGSSQQKILVLLNGHRLNSRAYSEANTDFSMSLDKIKQIEILRGPASSLYGNVALTAVINIITLSGEDLNGSKISIAGGNYGQKKLSITHGKKFSDNNELFLWGNYYEADGQPFAISKEQDFSQKPESGVAILDGIKDRPAYDLGLNYKYEDFSLLANIRANHYISPFSEKGQVYKPDDFRKLLGLSTGLSTPSSHLGLFYNKEIINDLELSFELYNDYNSVIGTVASDSTNKSGFGLSWNEFSMGGISQLNKKYDLSALGKGSFIFGLQADTMNLYDSMWPNIPADGDYKDFKDSNKSKILETGTETIYSAFTQLKHKIFDDKFIMNFGLRYDEKFRHEGENVRALSPRLSFIYLPSDFFEIKTSYSESFVDAPYWYRYNILPSYKGSRDLKPEHLRSVQLTPVFKFFDGRLNNTINFFYNDLYDFIYRDLNAKDNEPKYRNAGFLKSVGIEEEIAFISDSYKIRGNLTYQRALDAKDYPVTSSEINNVPSLSANLILDFNPLFFVYDKFSMNITGRYIGSQSSPIGKTFKNGIEFSSPNNRVDQVFLVNTGFNVLAPWSEKLSLDGRIYNVFDTNYSQGGTTVIPYPQTGRWFNLSLSYNL